MHFLDDRNHNKLHSCVVCKTNPVSITLLLPQGKSLTYEMVTGEASGKDKESPTIDDITLQNTLGQEAVFGDFFRTDEFDEDGVRQSYTLLTDSNVCGAWVLSPLYVRISLRLSISSYLLNCFVDIFFPRETGSFSVYATIPTDSESKCSPVPACIGIIRSWRWLWYNHV